ncbi:hypothetical protein T492DRAFT_1104437 [Pavlovales sp. CCMP2436]|nr:hypothetical protein T492DRAFT_1104437 [Pavlovales sp. CCMP2436]
MLLDMWPRGAQHDAMLAFDVRALSPDWPWAKRCSFNNYTAPYARRGLLALSAFTRGLLQQADAALLSGRHICHHEAFIPSICGKMTDGGQPCAITDLDKIGKQLDASSFSFKVGSLTQLRRKVLTDARTIERRFVARTTAARGLLSTGWRPSVLDMRP